MNHDQSLRLPAEYLAPRPAAAAAEAFPSVEAEARAFWRVRLRATRTALRQALSHARFRLTLIAVLSVLLWAGMFLMFADGFRFLRSAIPDPETHNRVVQAVFGMFFMALGVMLVFSSGIIVYGSLFQSREAAFLLTMPARVERVFLHKFQEAVLLSGWGTLLLGSPMLLAYGTAAGAPWYYYAMLAPFLTAFVYIPAAVGAILCMVVVHRLPGRRVHVLAAVAALLLAAAGYQAWSLLAGPESDILTPGWFQHMLGRLQFAEYRLLPSWWLSAGLLEATWRSWSESVLFLALMVSNALFARQLAVWTAGRVYRTAYSRLYGRNTRRKRKAPLPIDRALCRAACFLPKTLRLLLLKDLRLFRRDPVQWSQFLIFFGLLALYFVNIRRFSYAGYLVGWVNMVSFLNVSVVGLLLSTFTTRFVFPMISLEGRRFWVLGLLPVRRETILWSKFLFAAGASVLPCSALILLSDLMLRVSLPVVASHQLTCVILCLGLAGIAVGLGARLPNLREQSPSRIAAGFGGTLNLVVSTIYILAVVLMTALPAHFWLAAQHPYAAGLVGDHSPLQWWLRFWLVAGTVGSVALGTLATVVPLRIGLRAFREWEF